MAAPGEDLGITADLIRRRYEEHDPELSPHPSWADVGRLLTRLRAVEEERNNWAKHYEMRCIALAQTERERDSSLRAEKRWEAALDRAEQRVAELEQGESWREAQYRAGIKEKAVLKQRVERLEAALEEALGWSDLWYGYEYARKKIADILAAHE